MRVLKRKDFARWQSAERLPDAALCKAIREMQRGSNITQDEKQALQYAGKVLLELDGIKLAKAVEAGVLVEVHCEQDY